MPTQSNPWVDLFRTVGMVMLAILVLELVVILWSSLAGTPDPDGAADGLNENNLTIVATPPLASFQETIDRSLFSWNRKPRADAPPAELVTAGEIGANWLLTGLVDTSHSTYAIFSELQGERQLRLTVGDELDGWAVDSLDTEQVVLLRDGKRETYTLSVTDQPPVVMDEIRVQQDEPDSAPLPQEGEQSTDEELKE